MSENHNKFPGQYAVAKRDIQGPYHLKAGSMYPTRDFVSWEAERLVKTVDLAGIERLIPSIEFHHIYVWTPEGI